MDLLSLTVLIPISIIPLSTGPINTDALYSINHPPHTAPALFYSISSFQNHCVASVSNDNSNNGFVCAVISVTPREPLNCVYIHLSQQESLLFTFPEIMRRERHNDRSPPTSAEIQNERSYTSTPTCLHGVNRDDLTLLLGKQENPYVKVFNTNTHVKT